MFGKKTHPKQKGKWKEYFQFKKKQIRWIRTDFVAKRKPKTRNWTMFARIRLTCLKYCRCFDECAKCFLIRAAEEKMIIITFKCYKSLLRRNDAFLGDRFFSRILLFLFHCESVNSQIQIYMKFKWTHYGYAPQHKFRTFSFSFNFLLFLCCIVRTVSSLLLVLRHEKKP